MEFAQNIFYGQNYKKKKSQVYRYECVLRENLQRPENVRFFLCHESRMLLRKRIPCASTKVRGDFSVAKQVAIIYLSFLIILLNKYYYFRNKKKKKPRRKTFDDNGIRLRPLTDGLLLRILFCVVSCRRRNNN